MRLSVREEVWKRCDRGHIKYMGDFMEAEIVRMLASEYITPKAAAFLVHAIIEMTAWSADTEAQKEFKKHLLELFKYDS